jgi:hypothetical protein
MDNSVDQGPEIIVLKFADSKIPVFKEARGKDYIKYGEKNDYPDYLTYLFNKSAKHNAILTGKANYIFGEGFENGDTEINRLGETLNDIAKKAILDIEIYGGFRLEVIWSMGGKVSEIYHVDYTTIRLDKDSGYWYKETWDILNRDEAKFIEAFNPSEPHGSQLFAYNEYRPQTRFYPLPGYIGCNNYIETDIEISKFYLSSIRNGMAPSKMIQFFQGEPTDEKKRQIEHRFKQKFAGSENAGQFILVFGNDKQKSVQIDDLSGSEVDKMFTELNKTCQQEIFSGHLVTNPMLFGIKTEGQLGASTELRTSYEIFINTYAKPKASAFTKEISYLLSYSLFAGKYELIQTDPVGIQIDVKDVAQSLPKLWVFKKLGIPEDQWGDQPINPKDLQPTPPGLPQAPETQLSNENIKNLTPKQHQQVIRIIRDFSKGRITELTARTLLRTGYGLSEEDINNLLGIQVQMSSDVDSVIELFDSFGDDRGDYEILKTKEVFSDDLEMEEKIFYAEFKPDLSYSESQILDLIKKDPLITATVIATIIGQTELYVKTKIDALVERGILESKVVQVGTDSVIEWILPEAIKVPPVKIGGKTPSMISIRYSYEGPQDSRNRPFCARMLKLNRMYTRADIELISQKLGYSVFDRRGGFWNDHGTIHPYCRHKWKSNIVVKK